MSIKNKLQKLIAQAVGVRSKEVHLEHPENSQHGDYATNIAFILAKKQGKKPSQTASAIVKKLKIKNKKLKIPATFRMAGPGFINIFLKKELLLEEFQRVIKEGKKSGKIPRTKRKIMVEFAHPNTHKLFHIGHLRNITNGEAIVRILEAAGNQVIRANYQGDVGLHIAKCLWALCKNPELTSKFTGKAGDVDSGFLHQKLEEKAEVLAKAYVQGNEAFKRDKQAKEEILAINKKIYSQEDKEITDLWKKTRQWSLDYFEQIYRRVYSRFDRYYFEGEVAQKAKELVFQGLKKGIFKKSQGAIIFPGSKYGLHDRVFITKEGNPTYEGKDMRLGQLQFKEYSPDLIIHNVGPEQKEYFQVVFKALEKLFPKTKDREYHLIYGWVRLKKGKMSSRLGNVITGEGLLDEAKKRIKKQFPEIDKRTAEQVAVGAVKYSFLKVSPEKDVVFDFQDSISLQGNSGPYLQYTYARAQSVLRKSQSPNLSISQSINLSFNPEETALLREIYKFPEVIAQAAQEYRPHLIANFLYDLAQKFNGFYNKHRILDAKTAKKGAPKTQKIFRLMLAKATAQIIKNGLYLLGIKAPEKM